MATPFSVTDVSPPNGSTNVNLSVPVVVSFNRALDASTLNCNSVFLLLNQTVAGCPAAVVGSVTTINFGGSTLTAASNYSIVVTSALRDLAGTSVTPFTSTFQTAPPVDSTAPSVSTTQPSSGATIPRNSGFTVFFNRPMEATSTLAAIRVAQNGVVVPVTASMAPSGREVFVQPNAPFDFSARVNLTVDLTARSATGVALNSFFNSSFPVEDNLATAAPFVSTSSPFSGQSGLPRNVRAEMRLTQPVNPATVTSANFRITRSSTSTVVPTVISFADGNRVLRLTPTVELEASSTFLLTLSSGAQGTNGLPVSASNTSFSTGTTSVTTTPVLTSSVPAPGATNVATNATIRIRLDRPMSQASAQRGVVSVSGGGYVYQEGTVTFPTATEMVIVPLNTFPPNTLMALSITGLSDLSGNELPPVNYTFTTGPGADTTGATVSVVSPVSSATGVPVNVTPAFRFSEPVDPGSVQNRLTFRTSPGGVDVPFSLSFSTDRRSVTVTPNANLLVNQAYSVSLPGGYLDEAGNSSSSGNVFFTTGNAADTTQPTVSVSNPVAGATDVPTNTRISIQFSEPITAATIAGIRVSAGGVPIALANPPAIDTTAQQTLTLVPAFPLAPNTVYTIEINGVRDRAGLPIATPDITFTTGAGASRETALFQSGTPGPGATNVSVNAALVLSFSPAGQAIDAVSAATGGLLLRRSAGLLDVPATFSISTDGRTLTVTPLAPLQPNTVYRVDYSSSLLTNSGVTVTPANSNWTFTTAP